MRVALLIAAVALAACNPPADDTPGAFGPFDASVIGDDICYFGATDQAGEAWFAVDRSENGLAYARFKGETLKLMPLEPLALDAEGNLSGVFGAIDYPQWQIMLSGEDVPRANTPPTYEVAIQLDQAGQSVAQTSNLSGQCNI